MVYVYFMRFKKLLNCRENIAIPFLKNWQIILKKPEFAILSLKYVLGWMRHCKTSIVEILLLLLILQKTRLRQYLLLYEKKP